MPRDMKIFSRDKVWNRILSDLHADTGRGTIDFGNPKRRLTIAEIAARANAANAARIRDLGAERLGESERGLILALPADATELRARMGYAEHAETHTVETIVSSIRKKMGRRFVKLEDGVYKLGAAGRAAGNSVPQKNDGAGPDPARRKNRVIR